MPTACNAIHSVHMLRALQRIAMPALLLATMLPACQTLMRSGPVASPSGSLGPAPQLPAAHKGLLPTVQVAAAKGWSTGEHPAAAPGLTVTAFATGLSHPRWLYVLPNGDVLVAETNAPDRPQDGKGIKGRVMKSVQRKAGAGVPSANRITLLRDGDGDGRAEMINVFATKLNSPFGMALVGSTFYVANTDAVMAFDYHDGETVLNGPPRKLTNLPGGPRNHHWTKNILAGRDGQHLYATVGSNSNVGENGLAQEEGRAAIWQIDLPGGEKRIYATGVRNPNGMAWEPSTGELWAVANERDELGDDLVPDYLTSIKDGAFYGWPYSYYGQHVDTRVKPTNPELIAQARPPDFALGAHVAALGLAAAGNTTLPPIYRNGMFVGEHGSWNRKPAVGYKVVFVPFAQGKPTGLPIDVLTNFVGDKGEAYGRPVGVAIARDGALLVADDVGNTIWRVSAAAH
jgi:glucose/arabinose dehydrogenase